MIKQSKTKKEIVDLLKQAIERDGFFDINKEFEMAIGVSRTKMKAAIADLEDSGYILDRRACGILRLENGVTFYERVEKMLTFHTKEDAETVLNDMLKFVNRYYHVSVFDLCDMAGFTGEIDDMLYGWITKSFDGARIVMSGNQYKIEIPKPFKL